MLLSLRIRHTGDAETIKRIQDAVDAHGPLKSFSISLHAWQERPPASHWKKREQSREYRSGNRLRDYQLEGVNWLLFNWYNRWVTGTAW